MADNFLNLSGLTRFKSKIDELLSGKQGTLTAGDGITIDNNVISADGEVFVAVYEQTSYTDVKAAIDAHKAIVLDMSANNNQFCITFATYTNGGNALMYAIYKMNDKPTLMTVTLTPQNQWTISHTDLQDKLVSGTNIKTINNASILGSGNIDVDDVFLVTYDEYNSGSGSTPYADIYQALIDEKDILFRLAHSPNQRLQPSFFCLGTNQAVIMRFLMAKNFVEYKVESDETWTKTVLRTFTDTGELEGLQSQLGTLTDLTTDHKDNFVTAINEVYEKSGEPFRVKQWANSWSEGVAIEPCTTDKGNTSLAKMTFSIDVIEGADYQIVGMIAYEVFDNVSGGNRLNVWPVCQFTGNGQKELSVRWVCAGTTVKTAKRINAWVLLKHR